MVLRRGADQRRAADVDVLDAGVEVRALGDGRFERVEVDGDQVDGADAVRFHRRDIFRIVAPREDAAVDRRMQRLDSPIHHFGKAGRLRHIGDGEARVAQRFGGAAGRQQRHALAGEKPGEFDEPGLVGDGNQRAANGNEIGGHRKLRTGQMGLRRG